MLACSRLRTRGRERRGRLQWFVVLNADWIVMVAVCEFSIGVALCAGLFTRIAALCSLVLPTCPLA